MLFVQDSLDGEAKVFLDPNTLSTDGTVALKIAAFSDDEQIFAYGLTKSGSDWFKLQFKHVTEGEQILMMYRIKYYHD